MTELAAKARRTGITLHYRDGVTPGMRLFGDAGIFDIFAVRDPDGRRATLEITGYRRT